MAKRVCLFVDGENFRHSITGIMDQFDQTEYLPKRADWEGLFNWLVRKIDPQAERVRTYWYVIDQLDFYPWKFPDPENETEKLQSLLCRHIPIRERIGHLAGEELIETMRQVVEELISDRNYHKRRFDGWRKVQEGIVGRHRFVEFRRAGALLCNLFEGSYGPEKAVDIKLATDMILLSDIYDIAVVVSGDQDYVPAVQAVKDMGKAVINVSFRTATGSIVPGGARRLAQATDQPLLVEADVFADFLNIGPGNDDDDERHYRNRTSGNR